MIDFKEIPVANSGEGEQDSFELFARDFLSLKGYEIISNPSRGADGGIDLIVQEERLGVSGEKSVIRWLVSCKHYHSGKSVSPKEETNILERVFAENCHGFIGFYSTIASSGLSQLLEKIKSRNGITFQLFDCKKIESDLFQFSTFEKLFTRYFPNSYRKYKETHHHSEPTKLFEYYFNKEFVENKISDLFLTIFGTTDNILSALQRANSLEEFIEKSPVSFIVEDLTALFNSLGNEHKEYLEKECKHVFDQMSVIIKKFLADHLSSKHNIKIIPETQMYMMNYQTKNELGQAILYSNYLIVNPSERDFLEDKFLNLKGMLT